MAPYQVLLIDDDPIILEGLILLFQDYFPHQFQCDTAEDGGIALELLQSKYYHLIISDNKMPKLDGISLLRLIHKHNIPSYVIMLSGFDDYTYIRNALKTGAFDYLLKPVNIKEFTAMIHMLIPVLENSNAMLPPSSETDTASESEWNTVYFDLPLAGPPLTVDNLRKKLTLLRQQISNLEVTACDENIEIIFSHLSEETISHSQFQEELVSFVYSLMEHNHKMIQIIIQYKLSNHDILSHIKNLPHSSQLKELFRTDLHLFIQKLKEIKDEQDFLMIKKAKDYIAEHIAEPLTVADISSQFNLHPNYFSSLFKSFTGVCIRDYLLLVRTDQAKELLKNPQKKILDIAWAVGYQDAAHFNRAFKKITGLSPSQYRMFSDENNDIDSE